MQPRYLVMKLLYVWIAHVTLASKGCLTTSSYSDIYHMGVTPHHKHLLIKQFGIHFNKTLKLSSLCLRIVSYHGSNIVYSKLFVEDMIICSCLVFAWSTADKGVS